MSDIALKTNVTEMRELITRFRFEKKVMDLCAACPIYGKNWSCPPFYFDVNEFLSRFNYGYLFGVKMIHDEETRTLMNTPEMSLKYSVWLMESVNLRMLDILHELERKYPGSRGASGGSCRLCPSCARKEDKPCRFPDRMRNSIESLGFDVSMITEELLGLKLVWMKDALPPYQILVNALFTKERHDEIIY
jgi:predicted metal-binding protein